MAGRLLKGTVVGGVGLMLAMAVPASAQAAAVVERDRGPDPTCFTDASDVPGVPPLGLVNSTAVTTPTGGLNVTCTGPVPEGLVSQTYVGAVPCVTDTGAVATGHIVITTSGRATLRCHFPAP